MPVVKLPVGPSWADDVEEDETWSTPKNPAPLPVVRQNARRDDDPPTNPFTILSDSEQLLQAGDRPGEASSQPSRQRKGAEPKPKPEPRSRPKKPASQP